MIETPEEFANAVIFEWRNDRQDPPRFLRQVIAENTTARDAAIRTECAERAKFITFEEAEKRARSTDYAWDAAEQEINPINWPDASGFYFEGYSRAVRDIKAAIMAEPKEATR